ncbi:restriction endonuclease subunit S [Exiguobacterium sp.]|uniref:restriction endonuclease subunit S n=1 Tax=Exiguobacterium sp. TaxID=44751 RepID=UPI0028B1AF4E|nr:restriction endonuclease subunit S [Exiguobacterium sp.]
MKTKKIPTLQFKSEKSEWSWKYLKDISEKVTEKNKDNQYTETLTNSAELGIINQRDYFDKDISNQKNLNGYYIVRPDDFVYNPRISSFAPVGPIKRNKLGRTGVMSPLYYVFRTQNIDLQYLEFYFSSVKWHLYMKQNGDSGARSDRFAIKDIVFGEMPIPYPSKDIQRKIGSFFKDLDDLISLYHEELDALKKAKQGFLQKMFPRDGETKPVVRFKAYKENWKRKKLGDILNVNSGRDYKHLKEGNIPVYGTGGFMLNVNESLSNEDAIGIGRKGTIDKPQLLKAPFWTVDTLFFMTMKIDIDLYFCFSLISRIPWKKYDESTGVPSLSKTNIDKIAVEIPSYDEQVKIGEFFRQLDEVIELKEQELETLKQTRQGFLQKMFV